MNITYDAITAGATCAAVAAALGAVLWQIRAAKQLTCLQLFLHLSAQYDSVDMQRTRSRLASKLLAKPTALDLDDSLLVFYENLALLTRRRLLDEDLVWNVFSIDARHYWVAGQHYVAHVRSTFHDQSFFDEFEQMNARFVKRTHSPLGTPIPSTPSSEDARKFLLMEASRACADQT